MTDDNMRLWRAFEKTDPAHTKEVKFGQRKFTSIDAHWQIMRVTEQLGPVGCGWGYDVQHSTEKINDDEILCFADVTIWWGKNRHSYGPIRGCDKLYSGKRLDDDAPKKALTDALTKGLSHLGVSADVFLGLFDDNKYTDRIKREFAMDRIANDPMPSDVANALRQIPGCKDLAEIQALAESQRPLAVKWDKLHRILFATRLNERRLQLGGPAVAAAE